MKMNEIQALSKIVDELERCKAEDKQKIESLEHRIAELEANKLDKKKLKDYIDNKMGKTPKTQFVEPTVEELNAYLKEVNRQWKEGNSAENFIGFYGSKGWIVGKTKMVSWKKALCTNSWSEPYVQSKGTSKVAYCANSGKPKSVCKCERCV